MWDRLRVRERDRKLAILFVSVLVGLCCACALVPAFPLAGLTVGVSILGVFTLATVRRALALRQANYGPAPVGPLAPDEKAKARSRLVGPYSRGYRY